MRWIVLFAAVLIVSPAGAQVPTSKRHIEAFEGLWALTKKDCLDEDGPNSRTLIDLGNTINGKSAPIVDRYENHCLIEQKSASAGTITLAATCYEFWENLEAHKEAFRATIRLSPGPRGRLKIDGKTYQRCQDKLNR